VRCFGRIDVFFLTYTAIDLLRTVENLKAITTNFIQSKRRLYSIKSKESRKAGGAAVINTSSGLVLLILQFKSGTAHLKTKC